MDAGKVNNFKALPGNIRPKAEKQAEQEAATPKDQVNLGAGQAPIAAGGDSAALGAKEEVAGVAAASGGGASAQVQESGGFLISGVGGPKEASTKPAVSFTNGLLSTSLETLNGLTVASANGMKPISLVRASAPMSTIGIESTELTTISGKTLAQVGAQSITPVPPTAMSVNGIESTEFYRFS